MHFVLTHNKYKVKKRIWEQIHSRICCTLMVVNHSTTVILDLFPIFQTQTVIGDLSKFLIDKPSYFLMKRRVLEYIDSKCKTGIHGKKIRNIQQFQCQVRRKIFGGLSFILSEYYFSPFLSAYIKVKQIHE